MQLVIVVHRKHRGVAPPHLIAKLEMHSHTVYGTPNITVFAPSKTAFRDLFADRMHVLFLSKTGKRMKGIL